MDGLDPRTAGLLSMAAGLFQAGGVPPRGQRPTSLGQALGNAIPQGMLSYQSATKMQQDAEEARALQQYRQMQMQEMQRKIAMEEKAREDRDKFIKSLPPELQPFMGIPGFAEAYGGGLGKAMTETPKKEKLAQIKVPGPDGKPRIKFVTPDEAASYEAYEPPKAPLFSIDTKGENAYAVKANQEAFDLDKKDYESAIAAKDNINKLERLLSHINNSEAITGFGAEILKNVDRVRTKLFTDEKAGKRVADTELLDAMLGQDVFPMISQLGIGARGLDTPAEREFLRQVMTGTIELNKETLSRMAKIRLNVARRAARRYMEREKSGEMERYLKNTMRRPLNLEVPPEDDEGVWSIKKVQ